MEVMQQPQLIEEMENRTPLLHHQYIQDEEAVEEEEELVGRRSGRRSSDDANDTTSGSSECEEGDADKYEEVVVKGSKNSGDGSENGEIMSNTNSTTNTTTVYFHNTEGDSVEWSDVGKHMKDEDMAAMLKDVDVQKILSTVVNGKHGDEISDEIMSGLSLPTSSHPVVEGGANSGGQALSGNENLQVEIVDEIDEEVIELEFERAVQKMHTHEYTMHCPNCSNRITKVVLRRRKTVKRVPAPSDAPKKPLDLFGCLSCFSIFVAAGNRLNPFRIFGRSRGSESLPLLQRQPTSDGLLSTSTAASTVQEQHASVVTSSISSNTQVKGKGFDLFSIFGMRGGKGTDLNLQHPSIPGLISSPSKIPDKTSEQVQDNNASTGPLVNPNEASTGYNANGMAPHGKTLLGSAVRKVAATVAIAGDKFQTSSLQGSTLDGNVVIDVKESLDGVISGVKHPAKLVTEIKEEFDIPSSQNEGGDVQVLIGEGSVQTDISQVVEGIAVTKTPVIVSDSRSIKRLEIVKAIVYGGLMESIASLSVVSSAAASGSTTLNILALGLANLISGLVILCHNLKDLRYGEFSESNEELKRYKETLGQRENFMLHAVVAVLSYLVFGLVPPVVYGFTFRESDDKDFKLLAVAGASLLCIVILAIMKAYTRGKHTFSEYFKTVMYYVASAVMVSGIAYAVGNLVNKLMQKLGWWDSNPANKAFLVPESKSINPAIASY